MALTLPLQLFDTVYKCCNAFSEASSSDNFHSRLAEHFMSNVSLLDAIRLRRVSRAFRVAGDHRLMAFKQIEVKVYKNLRQMYSHHCEKGVEREISVIVLNNIISDNYERVPNSEIIVAELSRECLGIGIDSNMNSNDVRTLLQLLSVFKDYVEKLFVDSPIIDVLVSQINKQQVIMLLEALRIGRKTSNGVNASNTKTIATNNVPPIPCGPFFKNLKRMVITSTSKQLEHLTRLSTYAAIDVDFLYDTDQIDILCLKIIIAGRWTHKPHRSLFRHVTNFKRWSDSEKLGERYLQQFTGRFNPRNAKLTNHI